MNSISQNLLNVIKNRIKTLISPIFYNMVDFSVDNLFSNFDNEKYLSFISSLQLSVREYIKTIIVTTFEEIDLNFKNSPDCKQRYYVNKWNIPNVIPTATKTPDTLYVMADEKYIGAQDTEKDIMIKSFVVFESVNDVSKYRRVLVNRSVFSHFGDGAWPAFMDFIVKKYNFDNIKNICLLGDGASWIKSGVNELKLSSNNTTKFYLCEFHFKQAINAITSDHDERFYLSYIFNIKPKLYFIDCVNTIANSNPHKKETISKKLNYIINNYSAIKSMLQLDIGSSMESHISHLIASFFSSRPKSFSTKRIKPFFKINDYKNNNLNLFNLYIKTYNNKEVVNIDEEHLDYSIFDNETINNIPILTTGRTSPEYNVLYSLSHS